MSTISKRIHTSAGAEKSDGHTDHHADGHVVQFYETDAFLVDSVCGYIAAGLGAGAAGIIIATPAHRQAIEARLLADGLDLDAARARGAYIARDAAETLARFMADGSLDPERFAAVIEGIVARAARDGRHVRVFGEMVALLWANRDAAGAIRLEELWNDLRETTPHAFTLCCAYPMEGFAGEAHGQAFAEICARHTRVNPDEGYREPADPDERRRSIALLRQKARSLDTETAERKAAEQRVRVSERFYRRLFETSTDGILMIDPATHTITDANPAAVNLFDGTREWLLGAKLWQIGLFPNRETAQQALWEAREERPLRSEALPLQMGDGQVRSVELVASRFRVDGHDVIQCNLRDVTERRQLEQRTREALAALLAIAAAAVETPGPGAAAAAAGQEEPPGRGLPHRLAELTCRVLGCRRVGIMAVEPGTERLRAVAVVGLAPDEEPGWWAEQRVTEARGARLGEGADPADMARFRAGEAFILDMTAPPYRDLSNAYGVVTTLVAPMRVGEQIVGVLSLDYGGHTPHAFSDEEIGLAGAVAQLGALVLDRERLLAARAAAEAEALALSEANRRMDEFLGIASHELRTPLTALMANLQILSRLPRQTPAGPDMPRPRGASDDGSREQVLLDRSRRQVERIARLIGDMIDLARIREGKLEMRPELCDLVAIVREEVEQQRQAHPERLISFEPPAGASVPVHADPDRIGQVVTNYLTNAIKYSLEERPVAVCVEVHPEADETSGEVARVSVRDEGPGIPADERDHVWEMFHRVPGVEVLSGSGVGLGLGLHITRSIVERHGGAVGIESVPGEGATFWFSLPLDSPRD